MKKLLIKYLLLFLGGIFYINSFAQINLSSGKIDTVFIKGYLIMVETNENPNFGKTIAYYFVADEHFSKKIIKEDKLFKFDRNRDSIFLICRGSAYLDLNDYFFNGKLPIIEYPQLFSKNKSNNKKDRKNIYRYYHIKSECTVIYLEEKDLIYIIPYEQYRFDQKKIPVFLLRKIEIID